MYMHACMRITVEEGVDEILVSVRFYTVVAIAKLRFIPIIMLILVIHLILLKL